MTYNLIARLELENLYQPGNAAHFTLHDFTLLAISQSTLGIFCSANKSRGTILIECSYTRIVICYALLSSYSRRAETNYDVHNFIFVLHLHTCRK